MLKETWFDEEGNLRDARISAIKMHFLEITIDLILQYPHEYLKVDFIYDNRGNEGKLVPHIKLDTQGKVVVRVLDTRDVFPATISKAEMLERFEALVSILRLHLLGVYEHFETDVVILLTPKEGMVKRGLLAYFYDGEVKVGPFLMSHEQLKKYQLE